MNAEMPPKMKQWAVIRQKGKRKFVVKIGVLGWGLPMFVLMTFLISRGSTRSLSPLMIFVFAIIWAASGAVFGWAMWTTAEKKYQKYTAMQKLG